MMQFSYFFGNLVLLYFRGCFFGFRNYVSVAADTVPPNFRIFRQFDLNQLGSTSVTFRCVHNLLPDDLAYLLPYFFF